MEKLKNKPTDAFAELEYGMYTALETYSNVHRGSGYNSMITTRLYDQAREIILDYLGLNNQGYKVVFCTPLRAAALKDQIDAKNYQCVSSHDIGLSFGVCALAVKRNALPKVPSHSGGGTARLISKEWFIWANGVDKFEAGTPAIINIIGFARALCLIQKYGKGIFMNQPAEKETVKGILYNDEFEAYTGHELLAELRKSMIGNDIPVPTMEGIRSYINLDNSASTPTFSPIWKAFCQTYRQPLQFKQEIISEVRSICARALGAPEELYDIVFTSNTTESINLTAKSLGNEQGDESDSVVISTLLEHSSNDLPWRMLEGYSVVRLSVDADGFIDLKELETILAEYNQSGKYGRKKIKLVAISGASNVLGICNNIREISQIVHKYGARLLIDAAQLVAHRKVNMKEFDIDYLAFSAHKMYAPFGCGVLVYRKGS